MAPHLIIALDFHDAGAALRTVKSIGDAGVFYKVGLELFISGGYKILPKLTGMGKKVFLDLKIHDIPNTAAKAALSSLDYGADIINLHTQGGREMMMRSAEALTEICAKKGIPKPLLIGVTLLTSLDEGYLREYKVSCASSDDYVLHLAGMAKEAGLDGVVSSARETVAIKNALGKDFITITPGVRLTGSDNHDQKRVVTPEDAARIGTDYIVMGRPITGSDNPKEVTQKVLAALQYNKTL
ncbi:MAG: orotidine-5'-phosphate decarboxylase [Deferribacteraceae bacterium]|jgi:orotidine-5'-phosphate decarboxylase|nr:orotidine-5'-phosphate decarboxylase [Deferribacteraceae bacterium]